MKAEKETLPSHERVWHHVCTVRLYLLGEESPYVLNEKINVKYENSTVNSEMGIWMSEQ